MKKLLCILLLCIPAVCFAQWDKVHHVADPMYDECDYDAYIYTVDNFTFVCWDNTDKVRVKIDEFTFNIFTSTIVPAVPFKSDFHGNIKGVLVGYFEGDKLISKESVDFKLVRGLHTAEAVVLVRDWLLDSSIDHKVRIIIPYGRGTLDITIPHYSGPEDLASLKS